MNKDKYVFAQLVQFMDRNLVDGNYFDVVALGWGAENEPADTAEAVNTYFSHSRNE